MLVLRILTHASFVTNIATDINYSWAVTGQYQTQEKDEGRWRHTQTGPN